MGNPERSLWEHVPVLGSSLQPCGSGQTAAGEADGWGGTTNGHFQASCCGPETCGRAVGPTCSSGFEFMLLTAALLLRVVLVHVPPLLVVLPPPLICKNPLSLLSWGEKKGRKSRVSPVSM